VFLNGYRTNSTRIRVRRDDVAVRFAKNKSRLLGSESLRDFLLRVLNLVIYFIVKEIAGKLRTY